MGLRSAAYPPFFDSDLHKVLAMSSGTIVLETAPLALGKNVRRKQGAKDCQQRKLLSNPPQKSKNPRARRIDEGLVGKLVRVKLGLT